MGVAGLADAGDQPGGGDGRVTWAELKGYLTREVEEAARRASGREQVPEVDDAPIVLQASLPVDAVAKSVAALRDEAACAGRRLRVRASRSRPISAPAARSAPIGLRQWTGCSPGASATRRRSTQEKLGEIRPNAALPGLPRFLPPRPAPIAAWRKAISAAATRAATRG